jgi:GMP synthase-like glutamine amidotransferase
MTRSAAPAALDDSVALVRVLVLQHIACEPPGVFEDVLRERGATLHRVEVDEGDALPDWREFDAIVAMGGPMSANDEAELPWLKAEKALIREAVAAGRPFWGVCLGVQLLASALGARVYRGHSPEVGLLPVALTPAAREDPVFADLAAELVTLQWHGDTFELPDGAVLLASSPAYANQAFRVGRAYGIQFHLEVSAEMAREWAQVPVYVASLEQTLGPGGGPAFLAAIEARAEEMRLAGRELFERWLDAIVAPSPAAVTISG